MKARVKATGEIVHVGDYNTISHDPRYKDERTGPWRLEELDFNDSPDYWTRLEHQYAGMAMQGILANIDFLMSLANKKAADYPAKKQFLNLLKIAPTPSWESTKRRKGNDWLHTIINHINNCISTYNMV